MKKKLLTILLAAAALTTACSNSSKTKTSDGAAASNAANEVNIESKSEDTDSASISKGGNIIISETADPQNVNPLFVVDQTSFDMQQALYSPFFEIVGGKIYYGNGIAESVTPNEDSSEFTLTLKKDLKWHDGQPLTADDVVFTMQVLVDPDQKVPYSSYGMIDGSPIEAEKVDDLTVKIKLPASSAGFLGGLSQVYCIPKHIYEGVKDIGTSDLNNTPVGSGPFKFVEYKSGQYVKVERFDDWFNPVYLDGITFKIVKDANSANAALASGDINARLISPEEYETVAGYNNVTIYSYNSGRVNALFMNQNNEALKDKRVRQAISYALDKEELTQFAFTSSKFASPAYSILTPDTLFYKGDLTKYDNDQAKAKQLLEEAGQSDLSLNIMYISTNKTMENEALYIQSKLAEAGITIQLKPMDESTFKNKIQETGSKEFDLVLHYYTLGEEPSLYSDISSSDSRSNYSRIDDETLDELWKKGNTVSDEAERALLYEEIQTRINDNMYIYPIAYSNGFYAVDQRFKGFDQAILKTIYYDYSKIYQESNQ
ncbi:ABC transporter substrate-binding protein [Clostridium sp. HBUAS56010]|uniref:ABC transporter substrate-binding protein n=1 Tax=Clostridium sp. HBUAS56010 TaxID=2571127 RepID=UPI001178A893|nr:ABC transporter substrate-binding protein [Clostridium sp. HBUAS56010]